MTAVYEVPAVRVCLLPYGFCDRGTPTGKRSPNRLRFSNENDSR
jgi:hypothetical protein